MAKGDDRSIDPTVDDDGPVDVARVHHDDAFLDALAGDGRVSTESNEEYQLALLFAQWRTDIDREPLPSGPSVDDILAAMAAEEDVPKPRESTVLRFLRPVGRVAAAFLIVGGAATVVFSYNAQPGDPLWSIKSVVFSSEANATMAKVDTSTALDAAADSLQANDVNAAATNLTEAQERITSVNDQGDKAALEDRLATLRAELDALLQQQVDQTEESATPEPTTAAPSTTTVEPTAPESTAPAADEVSPDAPTPWVPTWPTEVPTLPAPEDLTLPAIPVPTLPTVPPEIMMEPTAPAPAPQTSGPQLPTLEPGPAVTTTTPVPGG